MSMKKLDMAKAVLLALKEKLGHEPSCDEMRRELNGVGLILLTEKILNSEVMEQENEPN